MDATTRTFACAAAMDWIRPRAAHPPHLPLWLQATAGRILPELQVPRLLALPRVPSAASFCSSEGDEQ